MSLEMLVNSRKYVRSNVTRIYNDRNNTPQLDIIARRSLLAKLRGFITQLSSYDDQIASLKWSESIIEDQLISELQTCQSYKDKINECIAVIENCSTTVVATPNVNERNVRSLLKSPTAPLPRFTSSDGEDLEQFLRNFETTVSLFSYTDYDKLLLLKQQVTGKALYLIDSLDPDKQTYAEAKELLIKAFASIPVQKSGVIKLMTELNLPSDSEPFEYMSKMRKVLQSVKRLQITADDVMQYFFFKGLNDHFKTHLIQITNKVNPTLSDIVDNFFEASERYELSNKVASNSNSCENRIVIDDPRSTAISLATKVHAHMNINPFKSCTICSDREEVGDHPIHRCPNYPSAKDKVDRLRKLNACTKCANLEHNANSCRFRFNKRCFTCSDWHFGFLCCENLIDPNFTKTDPSNDNKVKPKFVSDKKFTKCPMQKKVHSGVACLINVDEISDTSDSILPTFTCRIGNKQFRALRDSGSQGNFVSKDLLKDVKHSVVDSPVSLTVTGINEKKTYETETVSLNIALGSKNYCINAMVIPDINIDLKISNLPEIIRGFSDKGYTLADKHLNDKDGKIDDIKLILGANSAHCFSDMNVFFGPNNMSVYQSTPFGIILIGDVGRMIENVSLLPKISREKFASAKTMGRKYKTHRKKNKVTCVKASVHDNNHSSILKEDGSLDEAQLSIEADQILNGLS